MVYLKKANWEDLEKEWLFVREMPEDENGLTNSWHDVSREDFEDKALPSMLKYAEGKDLPEGYVPETFYFLWKDDEIAGQFRIRHYLCESLRTGAGHIGYFIARPFRGQGLGTEGLRLTLEEARYIVPEEEIYLRVNLDNPASLHVMLNNGGHIVGQDEAHFFVRIPNPGKEKKAEPVIETERLLLREYSMSDFDALYEILSDPETMQHYPAPFDEERTGKWIEWNLENYAQYGFGLWAVVLKETGEFIGDCGITIQSIDGEMLPEIGYHIHKKYWRRGFAKEAAQAVRDWVFQHTEYDTVYSYMKYTNIGSWSTALANGMKKVKEYPDPKNTISYAYAITRKEWETLKKAARKKQEESQHKDSRHDPR